MPDSYSSALARRPSSRHRVPSWRDDDNDRYGGSQGSRGNRARDRGEDQDRRQQPMMSRAGSAGQKRFIPCTLRTIPFNGAGFLCEMFKVSMGKVQDWCNDEYIRIDTTKDPRHGPGLLNIDPLREVVSKKDWERYEKDKRTRQNEWAAADHLARLGIRPGRPQSEYEDDEDEDEDDD